MLEVIFYFWNNNKYNEDQDERGKVIGVWYEVAMVTDRRIEQMAQLFRDD